MLENRRKGFSIAKQCCNPKFPNVFVKLRQGSGKEGQGMALKAKGLKA